MQNNTCSHTWFLVPGIKRTKARHRLIERCQSNLSNLKNQNIHGFFDAGIIFDLGQNEIIENISCSEFVFLNSSKQMSPLWDSFLHQRFKRHYQKRLLILGVPFRCWDHFWLRGETKLSRKIFCSEFVFINSSKQMSPLWDSFLRHRFKRRCRKCLLILGVLFKVSETKHLASCFFPGNSRLESQKIHYLTYSGGYCRTTCAEINFECGPVYFGILRWVNNEIE